MKKALFRVMALCLSVMLCMLAACHREQTDRLPQELIWQSSQLQEEVEQGEQQQYERLLESAVVLQPGIQRTQLIQEAEKMLLEAGRMIPLLNETNSYLLRESVQGYYRTASGISYFQESKTSDNTLHACLDGALESMDPALSSSSLEKGLAANCFSGLYRENEQGEIQPELVQSCESSADGMTYRFQLRKGLKWSDGTALTAKDVAYSWNCAIAAGKVPGIEFVQKAQAEDENTLEITLKQPYAYFLQLCASPMLGTVRQYASYTIGAYAVSGAYIPVEWQGDTLICRKNTAYWNAENVSCESLELMVGAKEKEAYEAFEAGRLEYTEVMPVEQRCIASRENPNYNCTENLQTICVGVSAQSALFSAMTEAEVRRFCKALSLLIDREYMAYMSGRPEAGMAEEKLIARQVGGEATRGQEDVVERYHQALQLLVSLGWELDADQCLKQPVTLHYGIWAGADSEQRLIAQCLQEDFGIAGICMEITEYEDAAQAEEWMRQGKLDLYGLTLSADYGDGCQVLLPWTSKNQPGWFAWSEITETIATEDVAE